MHGGLFLLSWQIRRSLLAWNLQEGSKSISSSRNFNDKQSTHAIRYPIIVCNCVPLLNHVRLKNMYL